MRKYEKRAVFAFMVYVILFFKKVSCPYLQSRDLTNLGCSRNFCVVGHFDSQALVPGRDLVSSSLSLAFSWFGFMSSAF